MTKCSNCEKTVETPGASITVCDESHGTLCAEICEHCLKGVLTMKIVFKRESAKDDFKFEQYLPVESEK
jgi:hypothetical protein